MAAPGEPQPHPPCVPWLRDQEQSPFMAEPPVSWQPPFVERLAGGEQPGCHPLHEAGAHYALDFSSVFAASPLLTLPVPISAVGDLCASPGGKNVFAWRALRPSLLLCNEVAGKRLGSLVSNLRRCHIRPAIAVSEDTARLAEALPRACPVVLVDAPCTGQSLLTPLPCYRMWPQEGLGAGAFTALFQNMKTGDAGPLNEHALAPLRVVTSLKEIP